jgi:hypothetical protein
MINFVVLREKFLHFMGSIYRFTMGKPKRKPSDGDEQAAGRPTIDDGWLSANRNVFYGLLSAWWLEVGSQITTADTREKLNAALGPLKSVPDRQLLIRFLRPTQVMAEASEIREKRKAVGETVRLGREARMKLDQCMEAFREVERAINQARPDQIERIRIEASKRKPELDLAETENNRARAAESKMEEELIDMEAAFAQDELIEFITKGKYARDPWNLANAMAGLPFAREVPFLGAGQSHARCSQIESRIQDNF